jgi:hypothetical protein
MFMQKFLKFVAIASTNRSWLDRIRIKAKPKAKRLAFERALSRHTVIALSDPHGATGGKLQNEWHPI